MYRARWVRERKERMKKKILKEIKIKNETINGFMVGTGWWGRADMGQQWAVAPVSLYLWR